MSQELGTLRKQTPLSISDMKILIKKGKMLRIMQLNCNSLCVSGKRAELALVAHECNIDILFLQETHLRKVDASPTIATLTLVGRCNRHSTYSKAEARGRRV